jgi:predicted 2-oxoglutarate/Fe(II)-dependent dioxygenase YbiX
MFARWTNAGPKEAGEAGFSEKDLVKFTKGLTIGKESLPPPSMHPHSWKPGQHFSAEDDPDRTSQPWTPPAFVKNKSPAAQREKTVVEEIPLPHKAGRGESVGTFARVVHNVIDAEDCKSLIDAVNEKGFTPALLNVGRGRQEWHPSVRDGHRVVVDSPELTQWIFEVIRPSLPAKLFRCGRLVELNERCRFLCYTPGQEFVAHFDGRYQRTPPHPRAGDCSAVTLQIYLHDVPKENEGATTFLFSGGKPAIPCQPRAGSVLLFSQNLFHEGSRLTHGLKYTLRTEAMYCSNDA